MCSFPLSPKREIKLHTSPPLIAGKGSSWRTSPQILLLAIQQYAIKGDGGTSSPFQQWSEGCDEDKRSEEAKKPRGTPTGPGQPFNSVISYAFGYRLFAKMTKMPTEKENPHRNRLLKKCECPGTALKMNGIFFTHRWRGRREYPNRQHSMRHHEDLLPVSR